MNKKLIAVAVAGACIAPAAMAQTANPVTLYGRVHVTFESGLLFDFDSAAIRGEARHNLDELARSLNRYPDSDLMIVGHTDAVGSNGYNQDLSERRAQSSASYLYARGVDRRIETLGRGENEPVASNDSESGRLHNRRVEIAIYASEALRDRAQREAGGQ